MILDKVAKMHIIVYENNKDKLTLEMGRELYDMVHAIKDGNVEKYKTKDELLKIKKVTEYFISKMSKQRAKDELNPNVKIEDVFTQYPIVLKYVDKHLKAL